MKRYQTPSYFLANVTERLDPNSPGRVVVILLDKLSQYHVINNISVTLFETKPFRRWALVSFETETVKHGTEINFLRNCQIREENRP